MKKLSRNIAITIGILIVLFLIYTFSEIVAYVLIAWVLSMVGQPLMRFFQKRLRVGKFKAGPTLSAIFTLLTYFIIVLLLIWMFVPLVVEQANNLAGVDYAAIATALQEPFNNFQGWLSNKGMVWNNSSLENMLEESLKNSFNPGKIGTFFSSLLSAAGSIIIGIFSVVFITFFFLREQGLFVNFICALVPGKYEREVRNTIEESSLMLTRYFGGILVQITIITIFVTVFLSIFGVKNALLIGFFAALINVIPYLGPLIGAAFGIFITISSNLDLDFYTQMLPLLLKVVIVFGSMQMLDNFILQPYIFSNSVLAHPLEIFIVILMGAQIGGITGMVLAIPAYTVIRVIARTFLSKFKIVQKITDRMEGVD